MVTYKISEDGRTFTFQLFNISGMARLQNENVSQRHLFVTMPVEFLAFASKFRWIDYHGNIVTPDIINSRLFQIPHKLNEQYLGSYHELCDWYCALNPMDRENIDTILSKQETMLHGES